MHMNRLMLTFVAFYLFAGLVCANESEKGEEEMEISNGRTLMRMEIQEKLDVQGHTCRYGCKCHESYRGPSAYNPSLQYDCAENSGCFGENDINCCRCKYKYYPPGVGEALGYNNIPCCGAPPTPPTPKPTLNCNCDCWVNDPDLGHTTCSAHQIGDGSNLCYGGGSLDSTCCGCPVGNAIYQYNCCRPTPFPTRRPTKNPTFPTNSPTNRPTKNPTFPTPPTTRRPSLPTSAPTPGSLTHCSSCGCRSGTFSTRPLDISFFMCCPSSSSLSYSCYPCC